MNDPTWTILIPTLGQRADKLRRLLGVLLPQVESYGSRVQVVALWNNGEYALTRLRQTLVTSVTTDYLCFIDDDDMVPKYYVRDVMRSLEYKPQYIGWIVECLHTGRNSQLAYHSLRYGSWYNTNEGLFRDISHVNPIRTDIAQQADYRNTPRYRAEDRRWADQVRGLGVLNTEVYINRIMYHYHYSPTESDTWRNPRRVRRGRYERLSVDHPNFKWFAGKVLSERTHASRSRGQYSSLSNTRLRAHHQRRLHVEDAG